MSGRFWGIAAALLSVFFGSSYSIFSKYLLQWTIPETLILLSQIFSILTILLFFGLIPELKDIWKIDKKTLGALLGVSIFSSVISPLLYMKGLSQTLAINVIVTFTLSSFFVGSMGFIWLKEVFTWKWAVGTLLMFLGIMYITTEGFALGFVVDRGVLLVAGSAFASALGSILYKKYLFSIKPEVVILVRHIFGFCIFILLVPLLFHIDHDISIGFQSNTWLLFLALALIPIVAALYLWYEALDHLPASLVGAIDLLGPFSGMILAYIFLHEGLYSYHMWGSMLIIIGLVVNLVKNTKNISSEQFKNFLSFRRSR